MKPKKPKHQDQADLFRSRLDQILDRKHPLFILSDQIDWTVFENKFGTLYADRGRPALPTRLMVGLHYLKHAFDESDESVVPRLLENPYWQYFCGFEFFIHRLPLDPSSLVRWRKRIGPKPMDQLLAETLEAAKREEHLAEQHMERVNVDTTVQEKAIAYPTDARLYDKGRVYRNILRNCPQPDKELAELLSLTQRLLTQKRSASARGRHTGSTSSAARCL